MSWQVASRSTEVLFDVLSRLGRELDDHFRCEEGLFSCVGMLGPEIDAPAAAHLEILLQYVELNLDLMRWPRAHSAADALVLPQQGTGRGARSVRCSGDDATS